MKRFPLFLLFTLLTLSTVPAQADIIDDTIGNIQQAINDAYNPDRGRDYEDSRDDGWQREVSDDRRRQYDDRRRQCKGKICVGYVEDCRENRRKDCRHNRAD